MVNSGMPQAEIMKTTEHSQLKTFLRYITAEVVSQSAKDFGNCLERKLKDKAANELKFHWLHLIHLQPLSDSLL